MFSGHVGPGHELADAVCGMTVGELAERVGQPFVWIDGIELAAFDKRSDHRPVVAALVRAGEQGILAIEGKVDL